MKLIFIFLLAGFLQVSAAGYAQRVSISVKNKPLKEVFTLLRKQSGYDFLYNSMEINNAKTVTISLKNELLKDVLQKCLSNQSLFFTISGTTVIIKKKPEAFVAPIQLIKLVGKVTNEEGLPLPGAVVQVKSTGKKVTTDNSGNYKIEVPGENDILIFSFLGFSSQEKKVGKNTTVNIVLKEEDKALNEVVVTALGISREQKSLGYATTVVKGSQLTDAISNNWTEALSGKVAGLNLVRSNGGPSGSNSIILRGESNLTGSNEALIVVDGVVMNNGSGRLETTSFGPSGDNGESPVDYGSGIGDINPDDIESVSVLKGPGAAALYGQRGANGAIIITTKSGSPRLKGIGITFNSNTSFQVVSKGPDYQYEYGQGMAGDDYYSYGNSEDGASTRNTSNAWGPKFEGQYYYQYDPVTKKQGIERTPWIPYPNSHKDFFDVGRTYTNAVTLDGGTKNTPVRFSFTNSKNKWIVPNTGYNRNSLALSASHKATDKFTISTKINYSLKQSDNLPAVGFNNNTIMYWAAYWVPNGNIDWLNDYWVEGKEGVTPLRIFNTAYDNPNLVSNEMLNTLNRNALNGNIQATYDFSKDLKLTARTTMDFSYQEMSQQKPQGSIKFLDGMYRTQNIFSQEITSDFLLRYNKKINKLQTSFSFGGSRLMNKYVRDEVRANHLIYPNIYNFANSRDNLITYPYKSRFAINSFYGLGSVSYNNYLYLDFTGRNDWNSVLATETSTKNVSFFYPSINLSAILSEMVKLPDFVSYAKLRTSYAKVGSARTTPYQTSIGFIPVVTDYPSGLKNPATLYNTNLKPLYTISYEVGADLRLFNSRLGLDITLYKGNTKDQILSSIVDKSTGFTAILVNAGEVQNKGIEIEANATLLKKRNGLTWKTFGTYSLNDNTVVSLTKGMPSLVLYNGVRGTIEAHIGQRMDVIYGLGYQRSPSGDIIYENGYPLQTTQPVQLGSTTAKWKASIGQEFSYKQFRGSFLFDGQYGGVSYSFTNAINTELGKVKSTLPGRDNGIIGKGVIKNSDGTFRPNDVVADNISTYYISHAGRDNVEANIFSTDFIKLREARFDYTLSKKRCKQLGLQKASIGVFGRDLWILSKWPIYDPEFGTINNGSIVKGFETSQFPSSKTFGLNLTIGI